MVGETRLTSKMSVTFVTGDAKFGERARGVGHAIPTCEVTDVCYVTPTNSVTCLTDVPLCHIARQIRNYVIVPFNIVVE